MSAASKYLSGQRSHDSLWILRRWRKVASKAGLRLDVMQATQSGYPVYLATSKHLRANPLYISAGVHGDEPAPVAALIDWVEENAALVASANLVIAPLFNPHGLANNTRVDEVGVDLNRLFHDTSHPLISAWQRAISGLRFPLALMLHEDYDAQGMYAYDVTRALQPVGNQILACSDKFIPRDSRRKIDGFPAKEGIITRRGRIPKGLTGWPEALVVFRDHSDMVLTIESPSEFSLHSRVAAQKSIIDHAVRKYGLGGQ